VGKFAWQQPDLVARQLGDATSEFARAAGDAAWQVAWCAGDGVVGTQPADLQRETQALTHLLEGLRGIGSGAQRGAVFVASSAGGLYAGAVDAAPYDETSPVRPLSPYGESKLQQEVIARHWSEDTGIPTLVGRISNLYGPGQNLVKNQGLITQICARTLLRQPVILYVPLDTIRDYLYVSDAAGLVADGLDRLRAGHARPDRAGPAATPVVLKVLASQQPQTVAAVLNQVHLVMHRKVPVVVARSPSARYQVHDLRMASVVWPELDRRPIMPLGAGIHYIMRDLLRRRREGELMTAGGAA
jgi:UDP-glucose 4-epimerase